MKTSQFRFICAIALLVATTRGAWCQQPTNTSPPFAALYCFGFSWTDTQQKYRSCNGSMWPEFLSTNLGLAYLPAHNLARGGATTADTLGQVIGLGSLREPQRNLYVVWVAATDVVFGVDGIKWTNDIAWNSMFRSALKTSSNIVQRLYAQGARSVVVQNCLDVSLTPQILQQIGTNTARLAKLKEHTAQFNSDLAGTLQVMGAANPDLRLMLVDTFAHLNEVYANAGAYGMTKVFPDALHDQALKDRSFGGPGKDYMFWDGLHGTSKLQALVSRWTLQALTNSVLETIEPKLLQEEGQLLLRLSHLQIGRAYTVQTSADLREWQDLTGFIAVAGTNQWSASVAPSQAFYRLKWQP